MIHVGERSEDPDVLTLVIAILGSLPVIVNAVIAIYSEVQKILEKRR